VKNLMRYMVSAMALVATAATISFVRPQAAQAQLAAGSSGFSDAPTNAHESEYWMMMSEFGNCIAAHKSEQALAFVDTVIDSAEEAKRYKALFGRSKNFCMRHFVSATMIRSRVRGVVAEGLVKRLPDETMHRLVEQAPAGPAKVKTLHDFAMCYVVSYPLEAQQFLRDTRLATQGEEEFLRSKWSHFSSCMPQGVTNQPKATSVRMAVAEALLRAAIGRPAPTMQRVR